MTMILDGSAGVTFPNSTVQASSGVVLQVVQGTASTTVSTTSVPFVTTGLTATITPKFSNSKIFVSISLPCQNGSNASTALFTIYRNSTNLVSTGVNAFCQTYFSASTGYTNVPLIYLDSPATTSATAYTAYMSAYVGQTVTAMQNNVVGTITLMEIAG